jgi:hypothetical protein
MALYYDLPVYRDTYKLTLKVFELTKDFPKEYKYTLGQDMKRDALQTNQSRVTPTFVFVFMKNLNI